MIFHFYRSLMGCVFVCVCEHFQGGSYDFDQFDEAPNKYRRFLHPSLLFRFLHFLDDFAKRTEDFVVWIFVTHSRKKIESWKKCTLQRKNI